MNGQSQTGSITYIYPEPASFKSQFLQTLMILLGKKKDIEKKMNSNKFSSEAAELPRSLVDGFNLQVTEINNRKVWTIKPVENETQKVILYIHGGGYISNLTKYDWKFIHELLKKTRSTIVVPDYPLAPDSDCKDVFEFFDTLYYKLLSEMSHKEIVFMGNSAGAGIALGFAQKLRNENKPQPSQLILNSPWLDVTMTNPEIIELDKKDKLLGIKGLQMAGQAYASDIDVRDFRVSPIYGDFSGLGRISLFIGTHDLFLADSKKLRDKLKKENIPVNYYEYPKMFHVWVAVTGLKESSHAMDQIATLINSDNKVVTSSETRHSNEKNNCKTTNVEN